MHIATLEVNLNKKHGKAHSSWYTGKFCVPTESSWYKQVTCPMASLHKHQQLPLGLGPEAGGGHGKCKNYPLLQAGKEIPPLGNTLTSVHIRMSINLKGQ